MTGDDPHDSQYYFGNPKLPDSDRAAVLKLDVGVPENQNGRGFSGIRMSWQHGSIAVTAAA